jgi:hypothetical protein
VPLYALLALDAVLPSAALAQYAGPPAGRQVLQAALVQPWLARPPVDLYVAPRRLSAPLPVPLPAPTFLFVLS